MPMIDLSAPAAPPLDLLDGLPRRVALTLPELRLVAEHAGGAPLPFDVVSLRAEDPLTDRLGASGRSTQDVAYQTAIAGLHAPAVSLSRRGLLRGEGDRAIVDAGLIGAVGLLATPEVAVNLDVAVGSTHATAWHRQRGEAVATLSTVDGIVFELAWFPTASWAEELSRVAVIPQDLESTASGVPDALDLPFELADAAGEAVRTARADLIPVLIAQHSGHSTGRDGVPIPDSTVNTILGALSSECRGRLRVLVAGVSASESTVVGVLSWTLLADGWRAFRPRHVDDELYVEIRRVDPQDLAGEVAPVLAEVVAQVSR